MAEPVIQQQGDNRIVVQLPGVQDTATTKKILGATATLDFRFVDEEHNVSEALAGHTPIGARLYYERNGQPILLKRRLIISGERIIDASSGIENQTGSPAVFITLDGRGAGIMSDRTKDAIGRRMAVMFIEHKQVMTKKDGKKEWTKRIEQEVINVAVIRDRLAKRFQITGLDSTEEARWRYCCVGAGRSVTIVKNAPSAPALARRTSIKARCRSRLASCWC